MPRDYVSVRLEILQKQLDELKQLLLRKKKKSTTKLYGIWKGVTFNDEDFQAAKDSLFKHTK